MRRKIFSILSVAILLVIGQTASAATFLIPSRDSDGNITFTEAAAKDLYTAGAVVSIDSSVQGDLLAAGGMINLGGKVEQDLLAVGGTVNVKSRIGDDARLGGGNITVENEIGGDLLVGGGNVAILPTAKITGDLIIGGGNVVVEGPVNGNVQIAGGNITLNGLVRGDIKVKAERLTFGPKSEALGKISYEGKRPAVVKPGAKIGAIEFKKLERRAGFKTLAGMVAAGSLVKLLAWFAAAWLLAHFLKSRVKLILTSALETPWKNLGVGLVGAIIIPVVAVLLFFTIIGYYAAFALLAWLALALLLSGLLTALLVGVWLTQKFQKSSEIVLDWQTVLLGVFGYLVISFVPFVGWVIGLVLMLLSFGATLQAFKAELTK